MVKFLGFTKLCECGCCSFLTPYKRRDTRFLKGHNARVNWADPKSEKRRSEVSKRMHERVVSDDTKEKISIAITELNKDPAYHEMIQTRSHSPEAKAKFRAKRLGHAPSYDKGIWYSTHLVSMPKLKEIRKQVCARDSFACIVCSEKAKGRMLITHHVVPEKIARLNFLLDDESNLVCLCKSCHASLEKMRLKSKDGWKSFIPFAKSYLQRFNYNKLLLEEHI